jgi:hypothetical protein
MAYATVGATSLFVRGGSASMNGPASTGQFFSLDLSPPTWSSSTPPWNNLSSTITDITIKPNNNAGSWQQIMTLSGDQQRLLVFNPDSTVSSYGLKTGLWNVYTIGVPAGSLGNCMAVAYPTTGSIYIPSGYGQGLEMLVYEPTTNAVRGRKMSPDLTAGGSLTGYSFVWSNSRGTMLLYGGMSGPSTPNPNLFEYNPKDDVWSRLVRDFFQVLLYMVEG